MGNGDTITDQKQILDKVKDYYAKLFQNKDFQLETQQLSEVMDISKIIKLTQSQAITLDGPITLSELGIALKNIKNKRPGIDGFPSEFFKVFWCKLKSLILTAFNIAYQKETLSVTLRQ